MKTITADFINDFINCNEIELKPTQKRLSIPVLNRIYQKMMNGIRFGEIKVCDNLIIDGHHRYLSSLMSKYPIKTIPNSKTSATIELEWKHILFEENDFDTYWKIAYLNEIDAEYNSIPLESIIKIISGE